MRYFIWPQNGSSLTPPPLIKDIRCANILGDKAFDCDEFINQIISQNCTPVIPPRSNRKVPREVDYCLYKERHLVECFFSKVKHFRRIFSRFDKMAVAYMGFLAFASAIIWRGWNLSFLRVRSYSGNCCTKKTLIKLQVKVPC